MITLPLDFISLNIEIVDQKFIIRYSNDSCYYSQESCTLDLCREYELIKRII